MIGKERTRQSLRLYVATIAGIKDVARHDRLGMLRYYLGRKDEPLMQMPETIRHCVVFVAYQKGSADRLRVAGTAFIVGVPIDDWTIQVYAVTARHVVKEIERDAVDPSKLSLRVNVRGAGATFVETPMSGWHFHPDDRVDVAATEFNAQADYVLLTTRNFATDDVIAKERIGPGDAVAVVGLFTMHYGTERNIPIVRTGNIAAMPEEPVPTSAGLMEAYLIEARSIGGVSGSPVFVVTGPARIASDGQTVDYFGYRYRLLGLMHGHWDNPDFAPPEISPDLSFGERINSGIAVVVPVQRVAELLDSEPFKGRRAARAAANVWRPQTPDKPSEL